MLFINHYPSVPDPGFPRWGTPTPEDGVKTYYYHPQTKFAKVMFLHLSLSHSVHRGGTWAGTPPRQVHPSGQVHPQAGTPPSQVHPPRTGAPSPGRYTPWAGTPPW